MDKKPKKCKHVECDKDRYDDFSFCRYHVDGGPLGSGETYDQYQIIEKDFIDFINIIPLDDKEHFKVHSPVLRDIIIRSCVQIEIFFKEWAKYHCSHNLESDLANKYFTKNKNTDTFKGARNWKFGDYLILDKQFIKLRKLHVRPIDEDITPFESWIDEKNPPGWWQVYNSIKHNGLNAKKEANLGNALFALSGLFLLHSTNKFSRNYLSKFSPDSLERRFDYVHLRFNEISTPIDSKKYLFKDFHQSFGKPTKLVTEEKLKSFKENGRI